MAMTAQQQAEAQARATAEAQARALAAQQAAPQGPTISVGGRQIPVAEYRAMSDAERQGLRDQITETGAPHAGIDSSTLDTFAQGTTFGWGDELRGLTQGAIAAAQGADFGDTYRRTVDESRALVDQERRINPVGAIGTEMAGALVTGAGAGGQLANMGRSLGQRALIGGSVGAAQGAAYGAGAAQEDERLLGAGTGAAVGGAVGTLAPFVGNWLQNRVRAAQQGQVLNQAAANAPAASEMRSAASAMFDQAHGAGIHVQQPAFGRLFTSIQNSVSRFRPNANLDPRSTGALQVIQQVFDDVMAPGSNVAPDLQDLHMLRQAAQRAAVSSEGRDSVIANTIVRQIDDFVNGLTPADIGGGMDPTQAAQALQDGISTWARANKVGLIEEAIYRAQNAASGFENGLRVEFRKILNNRNLRTQFTGPELEAIANVVQGTTGANLAKLIGRFGFGSGQASTGIGGAAGMALGDMAFGPVGMVLGPTIGAAGRSASERMTANAAQRALGAVATPNLVQVPPVNQAIPSMTERLVRIAGAPLSGQVAR
ncbi:hypothetical protein NO932_06630 [Pelagibacterium sp. 26DY04]|uniref:hypothetical protein n=1 Tax=Pelagibacterium sp. 26DY04 TaxID=2967130 RepID=UPI002814E4C4|nr:hypothetical protein [Pelagibacterium sp. 26DY04]WMT88281.1 hypothetical protein NO932_06630 [Pelagibacterium sp. 26DY04]